MNKRWRNVGLYVLAVITVIFIGTSVFDKPSTENATKTLRYSEKGYITAEEAKEFNYEIMKLSGTEFRKKLRSGEPIHEWFAFKILVDVLRRS